VGGTRKGKLGGGEEAGSASKLKLVPAELFPGAGTGYNQDIVHDFRAQLQGTGSQSEALYE